MVATRVAVGMPYPYRGPHEESVSSNTRRIAQAAQNNARLELEKRNENGQIISHREEVAAGATVNVHLENPSDSGVDANVVSMQISTIFQATFDVYDGFSTAPSGGTSTTPDNLLMDSDDANGAGAMNTNVNVSYTSSKTHLEGVVPSGGQGNNQVGGAMNGTTPLIEPGREIVLELTNESSSAGFGAVGLVWTEEDR